MRLRSSTSICSSRGSRPRWKRPWSSIHVEGRRVRLVRRITKSLSRFFEMKIKRLDTWTYRELRCSNELDTTLIVQEYHSRRVSTSHSQLNTSRMGEVQKELSLHQDLSTLWLDLLLSNELHKEKACSLFNLQKHADNHLLPSLIWRTNKTLGTSLIPNNSCISLRKCIREIAHLK
jgi:hypothetical protein